MAETNHRTVSSEPLPLSPLPSVGTNLTTKQQEEFNQRVVEYLRRLRQLLVKDIIDNITLKLPPGVPPCVLVTQLGATDWAYLTVPDTTKDYLLVYDSNDQTVKWIETTTTFVCPP